MSNVNLSVILQAKDKLTAPLRQIEKRFSQNDKAVVTHRESLLKLRRSMKDVTQFEKLKHGVNQSSIALNEAQAAVRTYGAKLKQLPKPVGLLNKKQSQLTATQRKQVKAYQAVSKSYSEAKRKANQLQHAHQSQRLKLNALNRSLQQSNIETRQLSQSKHALIQQEQRLTQRIQQQMSARRKLLAIQERSQRLTNVAGKLALGGGVATGMAYGTKAMVGNVMQGVVAVEKAKGELASVGVANVNAVIKAGEQMSQTLAGVTPAGFVKAAYDIKSGISNLSDAGVARMTAIAATTATATKAATEQMTSLFATGYGIYKQQEFGKLSDIQFGEVLSASLAKSVQQFKTDGSKMQQAIQSLGGAATTKGMSLAEQFTTIGLMQQTNEAGVAGNALKAFIANAGKAQAYFDQQGVDIQLVNENGMMRNIADILTDIKNVYGTVDLMENVDLKKAFGSEEAMRLVDGLSDKIEAIKKGQLAIEAAQKKGLGFTQDMAHRLTDNFASRAQLASQKIGLLTDQIGYALVPVLENFLVTVSPIIQKVTAWVKENKTLVTVLGGTVIAIGAIALVAAPVLMTLAALAGSFGVLVKVMPLVTFGIKAIGAALLTNPIGLAITGIATAAILIVKYWEPIKNFFAHLWDGIKTIFQTGLKFITDSVLSPIKTITGLLSKAFSWLGGTKLPKLTQQVELQRKGLPNVPELAKTAITPPRFVQKAEQAKSRIKHNKAGQSIHIKKQQTNKVTANFTINATPGMDEKSLTDKIRQMLEELSWGNNSLQSGALYDDI